MAVQLMFDLITLCMDLLILKGLLIVIYDQTITQKFYFVNILSIICLLSNIPVQ